jgi:hypothetical protein
MSNGKVEKTGFKRGGKRPGAGRPKGRTKMKICVSVNAENWKTALARWRKNGSRLVDELILGYLKGSGAAPELGAV